MGKRVGKVLVQLWVDEDQHARWRRAFKTRLRRAGLSAPDKFLAPWIRSEMDRVVADLGEPPPDPVPERDEDAA